MAIRFVGFNFNKISIEKHKEITKEVSLNTNVEIKDIKNQKSNLFPDKNLLYFEYEYKIEYSPDFATILFSGGILSIVEDDELLKQIQDQWTNKKVPENVRVNIMNAIFSKCNLKALELEEDLNLPHHIPFPKVTNSKKQKE